MSMSIAHFHEQFEPMAGEKGISVSLLRRGEAYCCKAVSDKGRIVGRWVSDCPLTVVLNTLLWLGQGEWTIQQGEGISLQAIIDQVPGLAPSSLHPQDIIEALRVQFPTKPTESAITGAKILLEQQPARRRLPAIAGPVQPAPAPAAIAKPADLKDARRRALAKALASAGRDMRRGGSPAAALGALAIAIGFRAENLPPSVHAIDPEQIPVIAQGLFEQARALEAGAETDVVLQATAIGLGLLVPTDGQDDLDEEMDEIDEDIAKLLEEEEDEGSEEEVVVSKPTLRPLAPGEIPPGLTPDQVSELESMTIHDPGIAEKLARTQDRARREHDRVERVLAARAAAAAAASPAPVASEAVVEPVNGSVPAKKSKKKASVATAPAAEG